MLLKPFLETLEGDVAVIVLQDEAVRECLRADNQAGFIGREECVFLLKLGHEDVVLLDAA